MYTLIYTLVYLCFKSTLFFLFSLVSAHHIDIIYFFYFIFFHKVEYLLFFCWTAGQKFVITVATPHEREKFCFTKKKRRIRKLRIPRRAIHINMDATSHRRTSMKAKKKWGKEKKSTSATNIFLYFRTACRASFLENDVETTSSLHCLLL